MTDSQPVIAKEAGPNILIRRRLHAEDKSWLEQLYVACFINLLPQLSRPEIEAQGWTKAKAYLPLPSSDSHTTMIGCTPFASQDLIEDGIVRTSLIAYDPDSIRPLGCLLLRSYTLPRAGRKMDDKDMSAPYSYIENLMVEPDARGKGIARRLISAAEEGAQRLGSDVMALWTFPALEDAVKLYERLGYVQQEAAGIVVVPEHRNRQLRVKHIGA